MGVGPKICEIDHRGGLETEGESDSENDGNNQTATNSKSSSGGFFRYYKDKVLIQVLGLQC